MALDEKLFSYCYRLAKKWFGEKPPPLPADAATLEPLSSRITFFARALSGKMIEVIESDDVPSLIGLKLFLPPSFALTKSRELNDLCYFISAAIACKSAELGYFLPASPSAADREALLRQCSATIVAGIADEFPTLDEKINDLVRELGPGTTRDSLVAILGALPQYGLNQEDSSKLPDGKLSSDALARGTEIKAKARNQIEVVNIEEKPHNPAAHTFEKIHTADEYSGGNKLKDGTDEILDHQEALSELKIKHVIRSTERTDSLYKADIALDVNVADLEESGESSGPCFYYDEWDWSARKYKKDWCRVTVDRLPQRELHAQYKEFVEATYSKQSRHIQTLKNKLDIILTKRRLRTRQNDGPDIDLDALVDAHADLKSGHTPSENLYLSQRRHERDVATLILIDCSLSTDSWILNQRVLDVIKDSVFTLGKVLTHFSDTLEVAAFYSQTRNQCHYVPLKTFQQNWRTAEWKLAALEPQGYTRIGPAIRHSTALLERQKARKKLLLLISDGKPTDYDKYEGKYGIEDVRQAVREANQNRIKTQALAIESSAKYYLPQMFGHGRYRVLSSPNDLSENIIQIYSDLLR